jgi:CheY-like chemotaxis protein
MLDTVANGKSSAAPGGAPVWSIMASLEARRLGLPSQRRGVAMAGADDCRVSKRVLIVEDEPDNQMVLRLTFEPHHTVFYACDLETADAVLEAHRPIDLIVLDHMLPDGWGLEFCRRLKQRGTAPPILFVTALTQAVGELSTCGDDVVTKPFDPEMLHQRAERLLASA